MGYDMIWQAKWGFAQKCRYHSNSWIFMEKVTTFHCNRVQMDAVRWPDMGRNMSKLWALTARQLYHKFHENAAPDHWICKCEIYQTSEKSVFLYTNEWLKEVNLRVRLIYLGSGCVTLKRRFLQILLSNTICWWRLEVLVVESAWSLQTTTSYEVPRLQTKDLQ